ncbi:hypothetical protein Cgig2_001906 [Carnegiea gigantea]|uniref:NADH:quinone oxidoreductase/Mrp antiporter transmembrane domain-containing protein n=1 Tax=Carnegiea gigantea TaxID=171969 RepID=A0A9Q1K7E8_9CARY|nr:hypothetical protein Cgig2_001906 [Carnegiea gigantea]
MDLFFGFSLEIRNRWTFDRTLLTDGIHHHFSYFSGLAVGILFKMGAYGLIRINMEPQPHAHFRFSPWLIIMGTIQIIYAASASLRQRNKKKRIAYSSISHMGFIIIGISSITDTGLNGAILQIISHGFIAAALFFLMGTSYDRIRLVYLDEIGRITIPMPKIFTLFSSFSLASLALPGMSGIGIYPDFILSLSLEKMEAILCNFFLTSFPFISLNEKK